MKNYEINLNGQETTLTFKTVVWYANGNHYDYPDDNYNDAEYDYEIGLWEFIEEYNEYFDWDKMAELFPRFCDKNGDFDVDLIDDTLT